MDQTVIKVLFVCMGNICRSPSAQGVAEYKAAKLGVLERFVLDSAGTHAFHHGEQPDSRSCHAAGQRGIDLSSQKARRVDTQDYYTFDYILAMDEANYQSLLAAAPPDASAKIKKMMAYSNLGITDDVPDPYYGGRHGFEQVLDLLDNAVDGFLKDVLDDI